MVMFWNKKFPTFNETTQKALDVINGVVTSLKRGDIISAYGESHNGKRSLEKVYGYPTASQLGFTYFYRMWKLNGVGNRIVNMLPRSCWRDGLVVRKEFGAKEALLEKEIRSLDRAGFFLAIEKADILNRLGEFAVLYIGLPDSGDITQPVSKVGSVSFDDIYFAPYGGDSVSISKYDGDVASSRYGLPLEYTLTPSSEGSTEGTQLIQRSDCRPRSRVT